MITEQRNLCETHEQPNQIPILVVIWRQRKHWHTFLCITIQHVYLIVGPLTFPLVFGFWVVTTHKCSWVRLILRLAQTQKSLLCYLTSSSATALTQPDVIWQLRHSILNCQSNKSMYTQLILVVPRCSFKGSSSTIVVDWLNPVILNHPHTHSCMHRSCTVAMIILLFSHVLVWISFCHGQFTVAISESI